jgi:hypothetical protein
MEVSGELHVVTTLPPWEEPPGTRLIGGWVVPIPRLHVSEMKKISFSASIFTSVKPAVIFLTEIYNYIYRLWLSNG